MFAALIVTLPARPTAVRLRVWRGLRALGSVALRDGAYLLPQARVSLFAALADEIRDNGGTASVWDLSPCNDAQRDEVLTLFDRSASYAQWRSDAEALRAALPALAEAPARRRWRSVASALQSLHAIDYYPGPAAAQADAELQSLREAIDARHARGEPVARSAQPVPRLDSGRYRGRTWVTRRRPWVDRLACAWLIRRRIDPDARFVWLDDPATATLPRGAVGYDHDGATFTHVGDRVTFEVIAASFGLDAEPALQRIARAVHYLDVGGIPVPEAAGLEAVLAGLRELHGDDDELVAAASAVFDALAAAPADAG